MSENEAFVNQENMALLKCPHCDKMKHVSVAKFKEAKHSLRVKCGCGKTFAVDLNFRSRFRKETDLHGYYHHVDDDRPDPAEVRSNCTVVNLSLGGIGLKLHDDKVLVSGDEVGIEFVLDDRKSSEIKRKIVVRHVGKDRYIGGEFCDTDQTQHYDKTIGFYLMP